MKMVAGDGLKGSDDGSADEDQGAKSASKQKRSYFEIFLFGNSLL